MKPLLWLILGIAPAAVANGELDRIQAQLARPDVLCGVFNQAKTLQGLKKPVKSSGRFCMISNKGVLWRTQQPFTSNLKLTRDEIVESQGEQVTKVLNARQEPTVRLINSLLFSLMNGDLQQLENSFHITTQAGGKGWQATLIPKSGNGIDRVVRQITLNGASHVQQIQLSESGGDRTDIVFSAMTLGRGALQADEAKQFE
ncbi:outer membrane lipoprotein carrier protein LolA [Chitinivorax sp. B]|uniref:LolA family protein n=1 Tax=Chitinivorax sp. B TaxID=2502235 RepID=UPI0010F8E645|nr:outer membrane lipoprotein carrier protein LolA [Chitinivorax sp. B]